MRHLPEQSGPLTLPKRLGVGSHGTFMTAIAWIFAAAASFYGLIFLTLGLIPEGVFALLCGVGFVAFLGLYRVGWTTLGRLGIALLLDAGIVIYSSLFGPDVGLQFVLFPAVAVPVLVFHRHERLQHAVCIAAAIGAFVFLELWGHSLFERSPLRPEVIRPIYFTFVLTTFTLILLPLIFFARARDSAVDRLRSSNEELQVVNSNLIEARRAADDANEAKSAFLADMSHELRTPLNAILGYSELISEELADRDLPESQADLEKIHQAGSHLLNIINDILDLSKIEAGRIELTWETFAVGSLVRDVSAMLHPLAQRKQNRMVADLADGTRRAAIRADRTRLRQALFNLLSNANKFTESGEVRLAVRMETDARGTEWAVFEISDTGIGMTPQVMAGIFQPFSRADADTNRRYEGTGLGLVISRRLCQMMGGDISVRSQYGKGSVFTMRIPAHGGEAADSTASGSYPAADSTESGAFPVADA